MSNKTRLNSANHGHSNSGFVPDDGSAREKSAFVIELVEKRPANANGKDIQDYDPYQHRQVAHPTT